MEINEVIETLEQKLKALQSETGIVLTKNDMNVLPFYIADWILDNHPPYLIKHVDCMTSVQGNDKIVIKQVEDVYLDLRELENMISVAVKTFLESDRTKLYQDYENEPLLDLYQVSVE